MHNYDGMAGNLQVYLDNISQIPLLPAEEEVRLAGKMAVGKEAVAELQNSAQLTPSQQRKLDSQVRNAAAARKQLISANTRLVVKAAFHLKDRGLPLDDLIQEGNIGLLKAVDRFNHRLGFRFSTYAMHWILNAMRQAIFEQGSALRLPSHIRTQLRQLWQAEEILLAELRRNPTARELAARLDWTKEQIADLRNWARDPDSLDRPLAGDEDSMLADLVADEKGSTPADEVAAQIIHERLHEQLQALPPMEAMILQLRYGLNEAPHTIEETAKRMELSTHQVRDMESKALRHMQTRSLRQASMARLDQRQPAAHILADITR